MPELPEVETVVRELNIKLKNKEIFGVEVRAPKLVHVGPERLSPTRVSSEESVKKFRKLLRGQKILSVRRRAKILIFDFSGPYSMLVHLKMTGQFIYEDKKLFEKTKGRYRILNRKTAPLVQFPTKHTHVFFTFTDNSKLYFNDVRKFAYLKLVHDDEMHQVADFKEYGPEPFSKDFSYEYFLKTITKRKAPIKLVLMDAKVVTGIGNIYSDEILFHAGIKPDRSANSLTSTEVKNVFKQVIPVLKKGIQAKGSSVGDFVRTDGSWGEMGKFHYVYGRRGQACKQCGTLIKSIKLGGRTSSYCPTCQK